MGWKHFFDIIIRSAKPQQGGAINRGKLVSTSINHKIGNKRACVTPGRCLPCIILANVPSLNGNL